jgi:RND family efflux transporter MFP subunit
MRRPERWWPVAVLVLAALIVVFVWKPGGGAVASLTCQAERGDFVVATGSQGELAAVRSVAITGPRGWNNKVVHLIDEGTRVSPGDTLALFDTAEQTQRVEERRTAWEGALADLENQRATGAKNLAEKEASLRRQELALEQARLQVEAMKFESASRQREAALDLRRSELDVEQARQELVSQREINAAELAKAEAEVRSERLDYDRAAEQLASMTVTAPDSGMVVYRKIWAGGETRKVRVGDQVWQGQPIMELPDLTSFQVNAWVQEVDVHRLEVGQRVDVSVDAFEGRALSGEITRIAPLARTEGDDKLKVFDVEVLVSGDLDGLLPGMTAQCRIIHEELSGVVHVPLEAVFRRGERTVVFAADGSARTVELGATGDDRVVVTVGVAEGDVLRLSDPGDQEDDAAS